MLRAFWNEKKQNILIILSLMGVIVFIKLFMPEMLEQSRYALLIEVSLWVLFPFGLVWEWISFKKGR